MKAKLQGRTATIAATAVVVVGGALVVCRMTTGCPLASWAENRSAAQHGDAAAVAETSIPSPGNPNRTGDRAMSRVDSNPRTAGRVEHAGDGDFAAKVLQSDVPVLVDFYADWCGPCQRLAPTLEQLARETPDARIVKVDVDRSPELAMQYGVSSIPSLAVFKDGQVTAQHVGLASKEQLKALLLR